MISPKKDLGSRSNVNSLTNDLLYDSNDSRDIEKGSLSLNIVRWLDDVDEDVLCQKLFFSVGEGCIYAFAHISSSPIKKRPPRMVCTSLELKAVKGVRFTGR